MESTSAGEVMEGLLRFVEHAQSVDLDALTAREAMLLGRELELAGRRLAHATARFDAHLEETGKFGVDGHKTAKAALKYLGVLAGIDAHRRVQVARALTVVPAVAAAFEDGRVPVGHMQAIARMCANPRVRPFLDEVIDELIAEQATTQRYDDFVSWLRELESLIDADGADQDHEATHARRNAHLVQNEADGSWLLQTTTGSLAGACMAEVFAVYEAAEWETDRAAAIAQHGPDATPDQFPRTPAQRRADAVLAIFRRAAATPPDHDSPAPLVNIVIDNETLETELARAAGDPDAAHDPQRVDERICRTTTGHRLHPADAVAALLVAHVRRVVIDASSTVIDLGRKRRCFTGSARDAALLQAAIRDRGGTRCFWACDSPNEQIDHDEEWRRHGHTNPANSNIACGYHNRLKEAGFRPVRQPDGTYQLIRPDGTPITPPA